MINNILHNALIAITNKKNKFNSTNPLTFTAVAANSAVKFTYNEDNTVYTSGLMYKTKTQDWTEYTNNESISLTNVGDWVQFKNTDINPENLINSNQDIGSFSMSGLIDVSGNIQSLLNFAGYCTPHCYYNMFNGCTSLISAPELPATTLAQSCYQYMFRGCTNLEFDFELFLQRHKNSNLAEYCFSHMVNGCTKVNENRGLIAVEVLAPASSLQYGCYDGLYAGCSAITEIPENYLTDICSSTTDCSMIGFNSWFNRLY